MQHSKSLFFVRKNGRNIKIIFIALLFAGVILNLPKVNATSTDLSAIVLNVTGNLEGQKSDSVELDLASLTKLESTTFKTNQPWTNEAKQYTGVRISTLLEHVGAGSAEFEAIAGNEYQFILRNIDFEKYPIILAYKIDDKFLEVRDLGPLLIVFPFDDYPELLNETTKAASVWQLTEMRIL